jgi:hypothetical protein
MKFNSRSGSWQIEEHDAALIKGMLARGDKQHNIAAFFGVNGGRIAEIATREKFVETPPASEKDMPPVVLVRHLIPLLMRAVATVGEDRVLQVLSEIRA